MTPELRARHLYVVGQSGTGKTTLMKRLVIQDMEAGRGLAFLDPHGDAARDLLAHVPAHRIADVLYFDPTSASCPPFNPFALPYEPAKLTADIVSTFEMFFASSWGERLQYLLQQSVLTLLLDPQERHTLPHLRKLLIFEDYRHTLAARLPNEALREFWTGEEFAGAKGSIPAVSNKLGQFLVPTSHAERLFSFRENALDFSALMNAGKILIVNLSKGQLGDDPSRLLGGLIATGIQQAALARSAMPESDRRPFTLYVDEFQNYVVHSFETILSEARKYKLSLVLAHQYLGQLPPSLRAAIFGNVATLIAFAVAPEDAAVLQRNMHRSRLFVRMKETAGFETLDDFVAEQRARYQAALNDTEYLGMDAEERKAYRDAFGSWKGGVAASRAYNERRAMIEHTLAVLEGGNGADARVLHELFPAYEFREQAFPSPDDFQNLPPHHAIVRLDRGENVYPVRCPLPPSPNPATRETILKRLADTYKAPAPEPAAERPTPQPPPALPIAPPKESNVEWLETDAAYAVQNTIPRRKKPPAPTPE